MSSPCVFFWWIKILRPIGTVVTIKKRNRLHLCRASKMATGMHTRNAASMIAPWLRTLSLMLFELAVLAWGGTQQKK